jgi:hypothetical protein
MVDLALPKLSAMAPAVIVCDARRKSIALLVGSAIAWKMSRLVIIMSLFDVKYNATPFNDKILITFFEKIFERTGD